ncbi:PREDICTED: NKG2-A/NKG2-B type II integral membrane protein-like [Chinchilla lanigera]|uniref:NKG2-A/NKG2-B type II integral membrane protein-like n=1 Tax=Chinchilla lanigera TaxID=34839 RepID=UPI000697DEBE|nr:PREDICTED: NKG2-A/NKG2-B type II integral membrane protein-like [Chinchilla lanigera]
MSNQQVVYSELNLAKDPKKQQRKPKASKRSIPVNQQEITYAELILQNASQEHRGNDKDHNCKDFTSPPEKLLAGFLGTTCLILTVTVIVTAVTFSYHCGRCPNEWLIFSNNCYYFGVEKKTWKESLVSCTSKNSSLLRGLSLVWCCWRAPLMQRRTELGETLIIAGLGSGAGRPRSLLMIDKFINSLSRPSWIGISRSSRDHPWMLVNGSMSNLQIKNSSGESNCVWLSLSHFIAGNCGSLYMYTCKCKFLN